MHTPIAAAPRTPPVTAGRARLPEIDAARCTGCGRCVAACGVQLLSLEVEHWHKFARLHDAELCTSCNACAAICPFHAITMCKSTRTSAASGP
jgi:ferredoxin